MEKGGERYGAAQRGALDNEKKKPEKVTHAEANILHLDEEVTQQYFAPTSLESQPLLTENNDREDSIIDEPLDTSVHLQEPLRPESMTTILINVPAKEPSKETKRIVSEPANNFTTATVATTRHEETSTQLLITIAEALNQTLREVRKIPNCVHRWSGAGRTIPYTFAGLDHENPSWFLESITRFFQEARVEEDLEKIHIFGEQLRGEAKTWFRTNIELVSTYGELSRIFDMKFNSPEQIADVYARLYGEKQKPQERVAAFITRKRRMCERLTPEVPFSTMAGIIINQLDPEIRSRLRIISGQDYEELIRRATQIESDVEEIRRTNYRTRQPVNTNYTPAAQPPFPRTPQMQAPVRGPAPAYNGTPPRPCTYCGAWHYHSQCLANPYRAGNARGTEGRNESAPPARPALEMSTTGLARQTSQPSTSRNPPQAATQPPFQPRSAAAPSRFRARYPEPRTTRSDE